MNNKATVINGSVQNRTPHWLYLDTQDDDFLSGKTPNNLEYAWEDEE